MRKVIIAIAVITCIFFAIKGLRGCGGSRDKNVWVGNNVSASFQEGVISESKSDCPNLAEIFIDASGSMKPYFKANETSLVNTLSEINNLNVEGTKIYFLGN